MKSYPIAGCGLSSKPRAAELSMFQILSWAAKDEIVQSTVIESQCCVHNVNTHSVETIKEENVNQPSNVTPKLYQSVQPNQSQLAQIPHQQIYKHHKSPQIPTQTQTKPNVIQQVIVDHNEFKVFQKSHLFKKQIKKELNSFEPINLKASRTKSNYLPKTEKTDKFCTKKDETELDEKTVKERKLKLKEFEIFTRVLPNSAFTTYYGKPAFENYGRGTSYQNLKSFNVMPHKGDNHPKNIESHYTALIKARTLKSKSHLPRKPIEETLSVPQQDENQESIEVLSLPLQKPDLIKSNRFATVIPDTGKKAGPPQTTKRSIQSAKQTAKRGTNTQKKQLVSFKQPTGDGLKYMNKRQNLIDLLEEKKLKASQLAYKVTECYPTQSDALNLQKSCVSKENWDQLKPAGKASNKGETLKDLIESRFVLKENINVI